MTLMTREKRTDFNSFWPKEVEPIVAIPLGSSSKMDVLIWNSSKVPFGSFFGSFLES